MKHIPIAVAVALLAAAAAHAQTEPVAIDTAPIEWLKSTYLACDRAMSNSRVDADFAQRCAVVGERLKQRAFGGDFDKLLEWWRTERHATPPKGDRYASS